jgi:putative membrane protein
MARLTLSEADRAQVSMAVAAVEAHTEGEIFTIVAPSSDEYRDVALHYCVLAMLAVPVILALLPSRWVDWSAAVLLGWNDQWSRGPAMVALVVLLAAAFLLGRLIFMRPALLMALTPGATKTRRVRRRAIAHFRSAAERRTRGRTGILIYLSLRERRAEIVADEAIAARVKPELWGEAMAALVDEVKAGRPAAGMAAAVEQVGRVLAEQLPRSQGDTNELPDRLIIL